MFGDEYRSLSSSAPVSYYVKNSHTRFYKSPVNSLVAGTRSQSDGRYFLRCKERLKIYTLGFRCI
jgi:hypothetical protein